MFKPRKNVIGREVRKLKTIPIKWSADDPNRWLPKRVFIGTAGYDPTKPASRNIFGWGGAIGPSLLFDIVRLYHRMPKKHRMKKILKYPSIRWSNFL